MRLSYGVWCPLAWRLEKLQHKMPVDLGDILAMNANLKLDRIDIKIMCELQKNGRITNVDLAANVGLSPSPCLQRVKRLETKGYISGYGARINLPKLAATITIFTEVTLADHRRDDFVKFETCMRKVDELIECHLVSGGYDYLLRFLTRDIPHYQTLIEWLLDQKIGIEKYFSYVVLKSPITRTEMPLDPFVRADH
jgi:DNA-binding Lrp family transcriptional regulator